MEDDKKPNRPHFLRGSFSSRKTNYESNRCLFEQMKKIRDNIFHNIRKISRF